MFIPMMRFSIYILNADIMAGLSMTLSAEANCLHSEKHSVDILVGLLLTPMMRLAIYILNSVLIS